MCQYVVGAPLLSITAVILLEMEFTRAAAVVAGILFHSSKMTSRSCWMLDVVLLHLQLEDAPHVLNRVQVWRHTWPLITFRFSKSVSSWRCVWGHYYVGKLPFGTVSEARASSSASECHSTCWNPCFPQ